MMDGDSCARMCRWMMGTHVVGGGGTAETRATVKARTTRDDAKTTEARREGDRDEKARARITTRGEEEEKIL